MRARRGEAALKVNNTGRDVGRDPALIFGVHVDFASNAKSPSSSLGGF